MQKSRQLLLQLQMELQRAVEKTRAGAAGAELHICLHARLDDLRVGRETQIVIRAQHDAALALHDDLGILLGLEGMKIRIDAQLLDLIGELGLAAFFKQVDHSFAPPLPCTAAAS